MKKSNILLTAFILIVVITQIQTAETINPIIELRIQIAELQGLVTRLQERVTHLERNTVPKREFEFALKTLSNQLFYTSPKGEIIHHFPTKKEVDEMEERLLASFESRLQEYQSRDTQNNPTT